MKKANPDMTLAEVVASVKKITSDSSRIVFVSGVFNVVHPGHLRLFNFAAECGNFLIAGITRDSVSGALIAEDLRLEGVRAISAVDFAFLLPSEPEDAIEMLKPHFVVKGKEHELQFNVEQKIVDTYGGKLVFSSGEVRFSSLDLLNRALKESSFSRISQPTDFLSRHHFDNEWLVEIIKKFAGLRVIVVGDLIVDEYVNCEPLGMSQEDPTIVVSPINSDMFIGGAGIVAAHAAALGASVKLFSVVGDDSTASYASKNLESAGVDAHLVQDVTRPTTLKKRYRARNKTLLRVSHLRQHGISQDLMQSMLLSLKQELESADLLVFSDFSYGCLTQELVDQVTSCCAKLGVPMVADSQSSSQVGDIGRFHGMLLISPTEHEARLAMRDMRSGLVVLAAGLKRKTTAKYVMITMGSEGLLVHSDVNGHHGLLTDQLPAMNTAPKDVSGAGDCLMVMASIALVAGASIWESAYLGSIAAACQVGRVGNLPLRAAEVIRELQT